VLQSIAGGGVCVPCGCIAGSVMRSTSHVRPPSGVRTFLAVPGPDPVPVAPYLAPTPPTPVEPKCGSAAAKSSSVQR
jgi:hypothetical protein